MVILGAVYLGMAALLISQAGDLGCAKAMGVQNEGVVMVCAPQGLVRVRSPTPVHQGSSEDSLVLEVLPAGSVAEVTDTRNLWLEIRARMGAREVAGFVQKSRTTWNCE